MLPESDISYLEERGTAYEVASEANMTCVVIRAWPLPGGFNLSQADLLLRLSAGYPDVPPDMWWFDPAVTLANGQRVHATEHSQPYLNRTWQRWSRHLQAGQWQSGIDGLESYLALISAELHRCAPGLAR